MANNKSGNISRMRVVFAMLSALLLTACPGGGGGGSSGPIASTSSFPLLTAQANQTNNGYTHTGSVTGTLVSNGTSYPVTGSLSITESPATSSIFENQAALLNTITLTGTITANGQSIPLAANQQSYSTTNYAPLGVIANNEYWVMQGNPTIPSAVKVGDTAIIGTFTRYTNSSKTTVTGTAQISYVVEADTATTAIINTIGQEYDTAQNLQVTDQKRLRIDTSGNLSWVSDIATGPTSTGTLTFTIN